MMAVAMSKRSLHISLPPVLIDFVKARVRSGRYATPSEYVRDLIRRDQDREWERENRQRSFDPNGPRIEDVLSSNASEIPAADWKSINEEARRTIQALKAKQKRG